MAAARRRAGLSAEDSAEAVADALVERLGSHPPQSLAEALAFGQAYSAVWRRLRTDAAIGSAAGVVYTPAAVARRLVELVRERAPGQLSACDPACGAGALLLAWLEAVPDAVVIGRDTDPRALRLAEGIAESWLGSRGDSHRARFERADLFEVSELPGDVVLMNPPFGTVLSPSAQLQARRSRFAGREADTFALALERIVEQAGGRPIGVIVPDVVRMQSDYAALRRELTHTGRIGDIEQLPFGAFAGVTVQPCLLTLGAPAADRSVHIALAGGRCATRPARDLLEDPDCRWRPGDERLAELWERCSEGARSLGDLAACHEGVHTGNVRHKLFTDDPAAAGARPMFKGADVGAFSSTFRGRYLRYTLDHIDRTSGDYASLRDPVIFEGPKLLSRQTTSRLTVCLDLTDSVTDNTLHTIRLRDSEIALSWLAIVLNSALLRRLYRFESGEGRRPLPQVKLRLLRKMPIRPPKASRPQIEALHERARSEAQSTGLRAETRAALNAIVFDSYGLPELDRSWLLAQQSGPSDRDLV